MSKYRLHKIAAVMVLAGSALWMGTGTISSVGSAIVDSDEAPAAVVAQAPVRTVAVVTPPRVDHRRAIRMSGMTEADKRAVLAARVAGIIAELPVRQGEMVAEGDLILRLDDEDKVASVDMAKAMLSQREAEAEAAERLSRSGNVARLQVDNARSALAAARAQLESAQAELVRNEVRAPFAGLVDRVPVELGSSIMQGGQVATVISLDPVLAIGEVSERDLRYLKLGDRADVKLVDGQTVQGSVRYISRDASAQTRTYRVEVAIPNADLTIPAGMTTEITLRAAEIASTVLPRSVVTLSANGDLGIRAVDADNKVVFYPIDLVDDMAGGLVLAGIPADARIIVAGQDFVTEGETVNPVEADADMIRRLTGEVVKAEAD